MSTNLDWYQIKRGIPVPKPRGKGGGGGYNSLYPFADMEIGDCFDAPRDLGMRGPRDTRQCSIKTAARAWSERHAQHTLFQTSLIDSERVRCWRIA